MDTNLVIIVGADWSSPDMVPILAIPIGIWLIFGLMCSAFVWGAVRRKMMLLPFLLLAFIPFRVGATPATDETLQTMEGTLGEAVVNLSNIQSYQGDFGIAYAAMQTELANIDSKMDDQNTIYFPALISAIGSMTNGGGSGGGSGGGAGAISNGFWNLSTGQWEIYSNNAAQAHVDFGQQQTNSDIVAGLLTSGNLLASNNVASLNDMRGELTYGGVSTAELLYHIGTNETGANGYLAYLADHMPAELATINTHLDHVKIDNFPDSFGMGAGTIGGAVSDGANSSASIDAKMTTLNTAVASLNSIVGSVGTIVGDWYDDWTALALETYHYFTRSSDSTLGNAVKLTDGQYSGLTSAIWAARSGADTNEYEGGPTNQFGDTWAPADGTTTPQYGGMMASSNDLTDAMSASNETVKGNAVTALTWEISLEQDFDWTYNCGNYTATAGNATYTTNIVIGIDMTNQTWAGLKTLIMGFRVLCVAITYFWMGSGIVKVVGGGG